MKLLRVLLSGSVTFLFFSLSLGQIIYNDDFIKKPEQLPMSGFYPEIPSSKQSGIIEYPRKSNYASLNFGKTGIYNSEVYENIPGVQDNIGYNFEIGRIRSVRRMNFVSYGFGLGIRSYSSKVSGLNILEEVQSLDLGNVETFVGNNPEHSRESVRLDYSYQIESEKVRLLYLGIPVFVEFGNISMNKPGLFLRLGTFISTPVLNRFSGEGIYSVDGYYEQYGLTLEGINELGFVQDEKLFREKVDYQLKPVNISGMLAGGLSFPLHYEKFLLMRIAATYEHGFTDLSPERKTPQTSNSERHPVYQEDNHILGNKAVPTKLRALGIEIVLQYVLQTN